MGFFAIADLKAAKTKKFLVSFVFQTLMGIKD
jgi:hypothetical protein